MMKVASAITTVRRNIRNHGLQAAIYDILIRSVNRFVYMKTLECVVIEQVDAGSMTLPAHLRYARLESARLSLYGRLKENELPEEFVRDALDAGDECYAVIEGNTLASYGWYSKAPTLVDGNLRLHFNPQYVYMYKGFTAKPYRGKRLHAIGMMLALNEYRKQGFTGLVSYVESNNFDSLKSCYRMGYKSVGRIRVLRLANRYFIRSGQGCSDYGLELEPNSFQPRAATMSCGS
jgi:hypothetical protein